MKKLILIFVLCATGAFSQSKPTKTGPTTVNGQLASGNAYFGDSASSGRPWVDVMNPSYGCKADGTTDDQPCFQAAINAAKAMNSYSGVDSTSFGATVYIPCGAYGLHNPIVLPRSISSGKLFGVVSLKGEAENCVYLQATSFPVTPTSIWLINPGAGYGSNPTCAVSGGGGSGLTCSAIETAGIVSSVVFSGTPSGFTSMPTIALSGGGGSGAVALAVGRGVIEWDQTQSKQVTGQSIQEITIRLPFTPGAMGIYYQYTATHTPVTAAASILERQERFQLTNVEVIGANQYSPASVYLQGDCISCTIDNLNSNPAILASNYETVGLGTDICPPSGAIGDEACGMNFSRAPLLLAGGDNGGYSPVFQGRANRFDIDVAFCDGVFGGHPNSVCYEFVNSYGGTFTSMANEGRSGQPQILLINSFGMNFSGWGVGQPTNAGGGLGDGLDLINSSRNTFWHRTSSFAGVTSFNGMEWVSSVTVGAGGSGYTSAPSVAFVSNCQATTPTGVAVLSGNSVASITMTNTGACVGIPSVVFSGGGGTGATGTANMSGLGTLFAAKLDSGSHNNSFFDFAQSGTADISFSDLATNFAETCDATTSNCATYFAVGTYPEYPTFCGTTSTCAGTRNKGHIVTGSAPLVSGTPSTVTITGLTPAFTSSSTFVCTVTNATTQANPLKVVNASGSSIIITGPNSVTDTANFICGGN